MRDDDFGDACQQKFQIQILELHVGFSIVDNTELRTRARARARPWSPARGRHVSPRPPLRHHRKIKFICCFLKLHVDFSIVDNTDLRSARRRARG